MSALNVWFLQNGEAIPYQLAEVGVDWSRTMASLFHVQPANFIYGLQAFALFDSSFSFQIKNFFHWREPCGLSYKHFTIVIYDPRVVIWSIFKSGTTLES